MKTCPNINHPGIANKWNSNVNTPNLGRVEAMREYLEAEQKKKTNG